MSPLDRKLMRDLVRMKGQAGAIAAVIAVGVAMMVMMTGLVESLGETRAAYYDRYRLADVFAPATRAPAHVAERLAAIPGVSAVEARLSGAALIDLPDAALPVQARVLSRPARGAPVLNDVYLSRGRMPAPARGEEVLLLRSFADIRGIGPGDRLSVTLNGARRGLTVTGLVDSPEFLYATAPGELFPDDARFGVIWMNEAALAAALDLDGAFNEALLGLTRNARPEEVRAAADRLLDPYGGTGAYGREDHLSDRFISEEISSLKSTSRFVPPVVLAIAAFLLYIVVGRIVQAEREEIGLLKAFGYTNGEVGAHYFKLVLAIATAGALLGCLLGIALGRLMVGLYTDFFKFPFLVFRLDPASFAIGVAASILAASAGGVLVLRHVFALAPAEAMRPPAPADYSRTGRLAGALARRLDQPSRMVLRRVLRHPVRMAGAVVGVACGMGLSLAMLTIYAGFDETLDTAFSVVDRSDMTVIFTHAVSEDALFALARLPGVDRAEPMRHVPVVLRSGARLHRGALTGMPAEAELNRALDRNMLPLALPERGLVLSSALAAKLGVATGDSLTVEVREGRRPVLDIPVQGIAETLIGAPAYMDIDALNRVLGERHRITGAYLAVDPAAQDALLERIDDMPGVAGVSRAADALAAFVKVMDTGAGSVRYVLGSLAFVIAFGIVYNTARIALAERARDLAELWVIGFTAGETAYVLLGELAVVTLAALPLGTLAGWGLSQTIAAAFSTELYQITADFDPESMGKAMLVVVGAALVSGAAVTREMLRSDPIGVLKARE